MPGPRPHAPLRIAFHSGHLNERGSDVALWDYAHFGERLLGHQAIIVVPMGVDLSAASKFTARFPVYQYGSRDDLDALLRHERIDVLYAIKYGADDGLVARACRTVVHAAFTLAEPHGTVYAGVSEWLAGEFGQRFPWVPHIVWLPDIAGVLRAELGIPSGGLVFGRHGGRDQFNLPFARDVVERIVRTTDDVWFVFLNTDPFCAPHPRIVHLPCTVDLERKARFVATCDAMLHARVQGETFGLAVGEFSLRNKPVLTWTYGRDRAHLRILREQCLTYSDATELEDLLRRFRQLGTDGLRWDAYVQFDPVHVMRRFSQVFLEERAGLFLGTEAGGKTPAHEPRNEELHPVPRRHPPAHP